jgi:hypothetical protein
MCAEGGGGVPGQGCLQRPHLRSDAVQDGTQGYRGKGLWPEAHTLHNIAEH